MLLNVIGDLKDEPNEVFSVVIYDPVNATLGDSVADITITDDDP